MNTYTINEAIDESDLADILSGFDERSSRIRNALGSLAWKARAIIRLLRAYATGAYRDVPWKTVAALSGAVVYFISPMDGIPDTILGIGYADDAIVIATVASAFAFDITRFLAWERTQAKP